MKLSPTEDVSRNVVRIVRKRIRNAVQALEDAVSSSDEESVHTARTELKKIRATQKLVRPQLKKRTFRKEQRVFRDAARPLSEVRDAKVLIDSLDGLWPEPIESAVEDKLAALKRDLLSSRQSIEGSVLGEPETVSGIVRRLGKARGRVTHWRLPKHGWPAIGPGLQNAYERARTAMEHVRRESSDEALHKWRKRTKDLRYELELLQSNPHERLDALVQQAVVLSDLLGDDHDLAVLASTIAGREKDDPEYYRLRSRVEHKRSALQVEAIALGNKLLTDAPEAFTKKIRRYWTEAARAPA